MATSDAKRRAKGRPRIDPAGAGTRVSLRLSDATYDELYAIASEAGIDISAVIREAIALRLVQDRRGSTRPH